MIEENNLTVSKTKTQPRTEYWRAQIEDSFKFAGTNTEFCKNRGLHFGSFKAYKSKLGYTRKHKSKPEGSGFKKVQIESSPTFSQINKKEQSLRAQNNESNFSAQWVAEFLKELLK